jgi:large subunit ribosomal protein L32
MAKHPVPKKKTSKSRRDNRRSHFALSAPTLVKCANCGAANPTHTVCSSCGYYGGKKVLEIPA